MNVRTSLLFTVVLGVLGFGSSARAQTWIDADQLHGKLPDWVDPQYYHADPSPSVDRPPRCIWVEPVYRTVCRRVWHEPVKQVVYEHVWIDGHYENRDIVIDDPCGGCPRPRGRIWVPGHFEDRAREIVTSPGFWEMVQVRELVTPGHWEAVATRD